MAALDELQIRVVPGEGVVTRAAGVLAAAFPTAPEHHEVTTQFLSMVRAAAGQTDAGRRAARSTAGVLAQAEEGAAPALGLVGTVEGGIAVLLHGDVEFHYRTAAGADERLSGRDAATWLDRIIDEVPSQWSLARIGAGAADEWSDLQAGSTRGDGVAAGGQAMAPAPAPTPVAEAVAEPAPPLPEPEDESTEPTPELAPEPPPPPPPPPPPVSTADGVPTPAAAPEPEPAADFVAVSLLEPVEDEAPRQPLPVATVDAVPAPPPAPQEEAGPAVPVVQGVVCKRGHFNDPNSPFCAICGISMVQQTHNLVDGPRPPLGVLVLDDGSTYVVDRDIVIGREPSHDPAVQAGDVRPIELPDPQRSISRVHAKIHLHGWEVHVHDAGSANGTFVADRNATQWTPVPADQAMTLSPGMHVLVGQRVLSFDSHRRN